MPRKERALRDALIPFLIGLVTFAYKQVLAGNYWVAGVTGLAIIVVFGAYRTLDHQMLQRALEQGDVSDLKPLLKRVGEALGTRWRSYRGQH